MEPNKQTWFDRGVLVTGISGFVGSALASRLYECGARVVGLLRDEVPQSNFVTTGLRERVTTVRGTLEDLELALTGRFPIVNSGTELRWNAKRMRRKCS